MNVEDNFLVQKQNENGVILVPYASGDGSLSFVFDKKYGGEASGVRVTMRDVVAFLESHKGQYKGWKPIKMGGGIIKAYRPMERLAADELLFDGKSYFYTRNPLVNAWNDYTIYIEDESGKNQEVRNENIKSAISFWLDQVEPSISNL